LGGGVVWGWLSQQRSQCADEATILLLHHDCLQAVAPKKRKIEGLGE
jgi:hypothetical protein